SGSGQSPRSSRGRAWGSVPEPEKPSPLVTLPNGDRPICGRYTGGKRSTALDSRQIVRLIGQGCAAGLREKEEQRSPSEGDHACKLDGWAEADRLRHHPDRLQPDELAGVVALAGAAQIGRAHV